MTTPAPRIFTPEYYARMRELESQSWWNAAMRDIAEMLLIRNGLEQKGEMLDAGCGSGQTMTWFAGRWPQWSVTGIDVRDEGLAAAKSAGLAVQNASILGMPFPDQSFDLVITLDVLQHLPLDAGDSAALRECARVLRPGGMLLVRTNADTFPHAADDRAFSFRKYRPSELRKKLGDAGLRIVAFGRVNALPGLAEIPRELRANRSELSSYHGILTEEGAKRGAIGSMLRRWVGLEGRALAAGWQLPLGRTIFALCRAK